MEKWLWILVLGGVLLFLFRKGVPAADEGPRALRSRGAVATPVGRAAIRRLRERGRFTVRSAAGTRTPRSPA